MTVQYRAERAERTAEEAEAEREREEGEKRRVREMLKKNRDRVLEIQQREIEKVELLRDQKELKAQALQILQNRLKAAVESYSFRPQVEADFERLVQETAAREIRKITVRDAADQVELFKNPGYSIDGLMKDIRFKVSATLAEAGLHEGLILSEYSLICIKSPSLASGVLLEGGFDVDLLFGALLSLLELFLGHRCRQVYVRAVPFLLALVFEAVIVSIVDLPRVHHGHALPKAV